MSLVVDLVVVVYLMHEKQRHVVLVVVVCRMVVDVGSLVSVGVDIVDKAADQALIFDSGQMLLVSRQN